MASYLPPVSILVLVFFSILTPSVYLARRSLALSWVSAVLGALLGWILILSAGINLPVSIPLISWSPKDLLPYSPVWLVDRVSWPFALGLATLSLAVILTDVAREFEVESSSWAGSLALTALGLATVFAGNPVSLLLGWAALDIAELVFLLGYLRGMEERRQVVAVFSARVGGIFLLLYGQILAVAKGIPLRFDQIPPDIGIFLLLATSLRLGVIPLHIPFWRVPPLRRGIGTISRMVPVAGSLVFLVRVATVGVLPGQVSILILLIGLAAIYAGFMWLNAANELEGRPYWILGMAALSLAAAVRGQLLSCLALGIALMFSGGMLFLLSARNKLLIVFTYMSVLSTAGLPFTPSFLAGQLYSLPLSPWHILLFIAQALLLAGYIRHSRRPGDTLGRAERWVWVIYPSGLIFLLVAYYLAGWVGGSLTPRTDWGIGIGSLLPGVLVMGFSILLLSWAQRSPQLPLSLRIFLRNLFSLSWFYVLLDWVFRTVGQVISFITLVLEGEGGVLWALLLLTLLVAFLSRGGLVGG